MKTAGLISLMLFLGILLLDAGCDSALVAPKPPPQNNGGLDVSAYAAYAPAKLDIVPLTELISSGDAKRTSQINLYVSLLDSFGSQMKSPGVFRFELYEYVQRSADPKGTRLIIWPDIDLTDPAKNNEHWRDFLRAYEFNLDFEADRNQTYVLYVTCLCPAGTRLSSGVVIRTTK